MVVTGIVAEYNPFHNGHEYQLNYSRENLHSDLNVVIMSGDFVQRGAPAIYNKYIRSKMALLGGADMIIEMPTIYSVSSAEGFASSAISLLNKMGCVDNLLFGAEDADLDKFDLVTDALINETEEYKKILNEKLSSGLSYPLARTYALKSVIDIDESFLSNPNNILGIEYVKALKKSASDIKPYANHRIQNDYHDLSIESDYASATAIRHVLTKGTTPDYKAITDVNELLSHVMPDTSIDSINQATTPIIRDDFSIMLHKALYDNTSFTSFTDCNEDISNKIIKNRNNFTNWKEFTELLKSKDLTHTRLSRVLSHILLGITDDLYDIGREFDYAPYIRILGFSKNGAALLPILKEKAKVPVIINVNEADKLLNVSQMTILGSDIYAADIYRIVEMQKSGTILPNEYTRKFELGNI